MKKIIFYLGITIVLIVIFVQNVSAKPYSRVKRVSDQRLAELETLVALSKMSGKLVTVPLGYGKFDPKIIGRKRRSQTSLLLDKLFSTSADENFVIPMPLQDRSNYLQDDYER
ncbi:PREDICTED: uncharacterized protein LOC108565117 [Nicrophorus vespilloides]|uniref:Uncharacterized protein LOC108565117 n=1 Tax=Nicrophorus vespilloides TaxID=110193 RepID=A0ABM1MZA0_NICVS|nr:PREDICTED: uncharacterized protein LOC108565117 [Nicrophorus vespilloides]